MSAKTAGGKGMSERSRREFGTPVGIFGHVQNCVLGVDCRETGSNPVHDDVLLERCPEQDEKTGGMKRCVSQSFFRRRY